MRFWWWLWWSWICLCLCCVIWCTDCVDVLFQQFSLIGEAQLVPVELVPPLLCFAGSLPLRQRCERFVTLHNHGNVDVNFEWELPGGFNELPLVGVSDKEIPSGSSDAQTNGSEESLDVSGPVSRQFPLSVNVHPRKGNTPCVFVCTWRWGCKRCRPPLQLR